MGFRELMKIIMLAAVEKIIPKLSTCSRIRSSEKATQVAMGVFVIVFKNYFFVLLLCENKKFI